MAQEVVDAVVAGAGGRRLAPGEWGLTVADVGGWPLDVGVRVHRGVLRAQAFVAAAARLDEHELLVRNRGLLLVRFAHTGSGDVWLVGELLEEHVTERSVDELLGLLVQAVGGVRVLAGAGPAACPTERSATSSPPPAAGPGLGTAGSPGARAAAAR